MIKEPLAN